MNISVLLFVSFLLSCSAQETKNSKEAMTVQPEQELTYKLYVQYENKKNLKEGSDVKLNGEVIGSVITIDQNPDAYIVSLSIKNGVEIPLLSKFNIKTGTDEVDYINIEPSDDKRIIRHNEYFLGVE